MDFGKLWENNLGFPGHSLDLGKSLEYIYIYIYFPRPFSGLSPALGQFLSNLLVLTSFTENYETCVSNFQYQSHGMHFLFFMHFCICQDRARQEPPYPGREGGQPDSTARAYVARYGVGVKEDVVCV